MKSADQLNILCSIRVRLNEEQRQTLKSSYREHHQLSALPAMPNVLPGSGISVEHAPVNSDVNSRLNLPHIVVTDLLNSREAMSLPTLLLFQQVLGVEVVSKQDLTKAFNGYLTYNLDKFDAKK